MDTSHVPQHVTTPDNYFLRKLYRPPFHNANCTTRVISTADPCTEAMPLEAAAGAFRMNILSTFWDSQCIHLLHLQKEAWVPSTTTRFSVRKGFLFLCTAQSTPPSKLSGQQLAVTTAGGNPHTTQILPTTQLGLLSVRCLQKQTSAATFLIIYQCICCFRPRLQQLLLEGELLRQAACWG